MRHHATALVALALGAIALLAIACSSDDEPGAAEGGSDDGSRVATATTGAEAPTATAPAAPQLIDLDGLEDLRARFNDAEGKPRILLLLSPT